jgi:hypothetical protein
LSDKPGEIDDIVDSDVIDEDGGPGVTRWVIISLVFLILVILVALAIAILGGISGSEGVASAFRVLRDFFIIVLALQGILISVALVVLILQITALINLLHSEIRPILDETRQTMATVRGTAQFVSRNVAQPVIRASSALAGARAFIGELIGIRRNLLGPRSGRGRK